MVIAPDVLAGLLIGGLVALAAFFSLRTLLKRRSMAGIMKKKKQLCQPAIHGRKRKKSRKEEEDEEEDDGQINDFENEQPRVSDEEE